jgi:hypothetical protein
MMIKIVSISLGHLLKIAFLIEVGRYTNKLYQGKPFQIYIQSDLNDVRLFEKSIPSIWFINFMLIKIKFK